MQLATSSCESAVARGPGPAAWSRPRPSLTSTTAASTKKKKPAVTKRCAASRRDHANFGCGDGNGRMVDEGMPVLRQRIHELRAAEGVWEPPADDWAPWEEESEWYATYDADVVVCGLVGALQALLMSERADVGLLAALALAVPASAFVLASHLLDALRGILSSLQH